MSEPTVEPTPVKAPAYEPWMTAVAAVMRSFVIYAQERAINGDLDECRELARVSPATAQLFEDSLDAIAEDVDDDTENDATPGRPGPGAAENPAPNPQ